MPRTPRTRFVPSPLAPPTDTGDPFSIPDSRLEDIRWTLAQTVEPEPPSTIGDEELTNWIRYYCSMLSNPASYAPDEYEAMEIRIVDRMGRIGIFRYVTSLLDGIRSVTVNGRYDYRNLSQRLLLRYVSRRVEIPDLSTLLRDYPTHGGVRNIPTREFTASDLDFLYFHDTASSNLEPPRLQERDLREISNSESVEFIVNGQKVNLSIQGMNNRDDGSRYISAVNIRVTSNRGSNIRSILQLPIQAQRLNFYRLSVNRPIHGFKFVRRLGESRVIVKEVQ